jgi:uncharacterized DUF497 family protein
LQFEWDPRKAAGNLSRHGVSFHEAATVFDDPLAITYPDPDHSRDESRHLTFGTSTNGHLLVVAHTEVRNTIRIISSRLATRKERKIYEKS